MNCSIVKPLLSDTQWDLKNVSDYRRLLDYGVTITILKYGDCIPSDGRIKEVLE